MAKTRGIVPGLALVAAIVLVAGSSGTRAAETMVHRCLSPDGKIAFSQLPCARDTAQEELTVKDRRSGWVPPAGDSARRRRPTEERSGGGGDDEAAQNKREEQCWKKRRQLDEVNWKLRRGYKPSQGDILRHKRRSYEDYLRRHCR
jgi:hypothetical protein